MPKGFATKSTEAKPSRRLVKKKPHEEKVRVLLVFPPDILEKASVVSTAKQWLQKGGLDLKAAEVNQVAWPEAWEGPSHGPQRIPQLVTHKDQLQLYLSEYEPQVLVFFSSVLWEAFEAIDSGLEWKSSLERGRSILVGRPKTFIQRRSAGVVLGLPVPSRVTNDNWTQDLFKALQGVFK